MKRNVERFEIFFKCRILADDVVCYTENATKKRCGSADVAPTQGQLYRTFHRGQAFLRGVTIGRDLAWFHYARNNVFSRLRLVISWRFRLVESTTRNPHTGLAQRTRTTGNGDDTALQFATRTPRISSSGKTSDRSFSSSPLARG